MGSAVAAADDDDEGKASPVVTVAAVEPSPLSRGATALPDCVAGPADFGVGLGRGAGRSVAVVVLALVVVLEGRAAAEAEAEEEEPAPPPTSAGLGPVPDPEGDDEGGPAVVRFPAPEVVAPDWRGPGPGARCTCCFSGCGGQERAAAGRRGSGTRQADQSAYIDSHTPC